MTQYLLGWTLAGEKKNCWIYFMVKFMAKSLTEQYELLKKVFQSQIKTNKTTFHIVS